MGFLDSLKKILNAAEQIADAVGVQQSAPEQGSAPAASPAKPEVSAPLSCNPAKLSREIETVFYGGETGDDEYRVTFMLSGDFIEFNSHCEWAPSYQYEPENDEDYTDFQAGLPSIFFGPYDSAYDAGHAYAEEGRQPEKGFVRSENPVFLFRAFFPYDGKDQLVAYVFAPGTTMEYQVLALTYPLHLVGSPLEQKLLAALDETAASYTETKMN